MTTMRKCVRVCEENKVRLWVVQTVLLEANVDRSLVVIWIVISEPSLREGQGIVVRKMYKVYMIERLSPYKTHVE